MGAKIDVRLDTGGNVILEQQAECGGLSVIFVPFADVDSLLKRITQVAEMWRLKQHNKNN